MTNYYLIYSPNENKKPPALSKLRDTSSWEKRRVKGKVAVQKMVVDLMELYLHRLKQRRPPYAKNPAMDEFASHFPYEPTPDQKQVMFPTFSLPVLTVYCLSFVTRSIYQAMRKYIVVHSRLLITSNRDVFLWFLVDTSQICIRKRHWDTLVK